jgi:anti-anti-sigma factor
MTKRNGTYCFEYTQNQTTHKEETKMYITVTEAQGNVPVTVMHIQGELDASNYKRLIARARQAYEIGVRDILLDLSEMPFMGSSGLVALHSVAVLLRGEEPPDPESGWAAIRAIDRDRSVGLQEHIKLLNPQPRVDRVLEMAGFKQFFEIHTDLDTAIASF